MIRKYLLQAIRRVMFPLGLTLLNLWISASAPSPLAWFMLAFTTFWLAIQWWAFWVVAEKVEQEARS